MHSAVHTSQWYTALCNNESGMATKKKNNPAAVALGRKGGKNSRKYLSAAKKKELAQTAANARWSKKKK
jgi:hypothetical protein